jgi:hypothetical protein
MSDDFMDIGFCSPRDASDRSRLKEEAGLTENGRGRKYVIGLTLGPVARKSNLSKVSMGQLV